MSKSNRRIVRVFWLQMVVAQYGLLRRWRGLKVKRLSGCRRQGVGIGNQCVLCTGNPVVASKILRTFLQKEHIPNFSEDGETNVIAAEIEEAGEFCFEDADGLDGADGEYEVFVTVSKVDR